MATKKKTTRKAVKMITVHAMKKKIRIPNDAKASQKISDFVVDKLRIASFQLVSAPDESGEVIRLSELSSYTGEHLYVMERNKAQ